jgi:transcriptional regulator of acetoin/glycerol metabolism
VSEPVRTQSASDNDDVVAASPAVAQLYVALECERPLAAPTRHLLGDVDVVVVGRSTARDAARARRGGLHHLDLRVADRLVSQTHVHVVRSRGKFLLEDAGAKNGVTINGARVRKAVLRDGDLIEIGRTCLVFRDAVPAIAPQLADAAIDAIAPPLPAMPSFLASLHDAMRAAALVAPRDVAISIVGETGTGKEVVARAIHEASRRDGPFVAVNCAALPATLIESSLFGHRRGAFSGAVDDNPGFVRAAHRGTLFLDEIADLPRSAQAALLRVLQEREVIAIGDTRPTAVDLRVACASQHRLDELVGRGEFRADLLSRLSGLTVALPRLADRREDLGLVIAALLRRLVDRRALDRVRLAPAAARALFRYAWPLNVRELEKALGTALALAGDATIELAHLPDAVRAAAQPPPPDEPAPIAPVAPDELPPGEQRVRAELVALLEEHAGNVSAVARAMGKGRMQIHRWVQRWGIALESFRRP